MTDVLALFAVLFGVYLLQCVAWTHSDDVALRVDWKLRGKPLHGFPRIGRAENRLFLLNPFSPLAGAIVCERFPVVRMDPSGSPESLAIEQASGMAAEGVVVLRRGQKEPFHTVGRDILAGEFLIYRAHSYAFANILVGLLERLQRAPQREWDRILEHEYEKMFDASGVASRLSEYRFHSAFLRATTVLLFVFLFGIAPLEIRLLGLGRSWPFLTAYLVGSLGCASWGFLHAQKALYPGQTEGRWQHALTFALSPLSAIRANGVLLRDLFCAFHPLAVARILMTEENFRVQAERELRNSIYLGRRTRPTEGMHLALEAFLRRFGINVDELLKPPVRQSANSCTYCPLCLSQFVIDEGECPDCMGVRLEKYSSKA
jgi:hypothetical protein